MTGWGLIWVSANVICLPASSSLNSTSGVPVRLDSVLQPWVARRPLVAPDMCMTASPALIGVSMRGRPAPAPQPVPWARRSSSISSSAMSMMPLAGMPGFSTSGPTVSNLLRIWV